MPFVANLYLSFTDYSIGRVEPQWIGLANYIEIFTKDEVFARSVGNTVYYLAISVPIGLALAFAIALLLNTRVRGMQLYRTIYYMPSVVPAVAAAIIFSGLLSTRYGFINQFLVLIGLDPVRWLSRPEWIKPSLIIMSLWGFGAQMVIFLAGLQGIPKELYEAAAIDGGSGWHRLRHITVPLMTPTIFFNMIIGIIGSFQVFDSVFVLLDANGGPLQAGLMYMVNVYNNAFSYFRLGYAGALSVILFFIILVFTLIMVRTSDRWVFYTGERD
jgi:multiple sugar transport system permease protein